MNTYEWLVQLPKEIEDGLYKIGDTCFWVISDTNNKIMSVFIQSTNGESLRKDLSELLTKKPRKVKKLDDLEKIDIIKRIHVLASLYTDEMLLENFLGMLKNYRAESTGVPLNPEHFGLKDEQEV